MTKKVHLPSRGGILPAIRSASRSESKAIKVEGCQVISKIVATETPGVVATYTRRPWKGETEKCNLFREGIMEAPAEWSRRRSNDDEETTRERKMELMFTRTRNPLPYGSVALMCAPSDRTSSFAKDGMFSEGDGMVWIHDFFRHVRGVEYDVPNVLPVDENRAVPLTSLAGLGQGIEGYMEEVSRASRTSLTTRYRMRRDVVDSARSNLVFMSKRPQDAFVDCRPAKMRKIDRRRAHVQPSLFEACNSGERVQSSTTGEGYSVERFESDSGKGCRRPPTNDAIALSCSGLEIHVF
ncbi:unnamed protein product [Ectocarpus sp. CCAP 1310/34]|nr:unnamed protein product [Ectocarpus sp. CCAP 1310/34]